MRPDILIGWVNAEGHHDLSGGVMRSAGVTGGRP